jgi:hypothetical protein
MWGSDGTWRFMVFFMFLGMTLGLWKLAEIVWWIATHVRVTW